MMGIETTGQWGTCEACLQAKAKRHAVSKVTDERASKKGERFFVDVGGPMKHSSLGGNSYVVIFVDDCTRFKEVKFVKKKSDTTAALLSLIVDYVTPQELSMKCVRTDNGGEFEGESSVNWIGVASRTSIPRRTRRSTTGWPNVRLDCYERRPWL